MRRADRPVATMMQCLAGQVPVRSVDGVLETLGASTFADSVAALRRMEADQLAGPALLVP